MKDESIFWNCKTHDDLDQGDLVKITRKAKECRKLKKVGAHGPMPCIAISAVKTPKNCQATLIVYGYGIVKDSSLLRAIQRRYYRSLISTYSRVLK